ncbi:response regulator transcription factor [Chloroflexota bacterium]
MDKVRVFISDWQVLFREGIHFILFDERDFEVVGEATSNKEALEFIENDPPNIAIFNAGSANPSGIDVTRHIKKTCQA